MPHFTHPLHKRSTLSIMMFLVPVILAAAGFGILFMLITQGLPFEPGSFYTGLLYLLVIALALAVPYVMLKATAHIAHLRSPQERELKMHDLAKDKEQYEKREPNT